MCPNYRGRVTFPSSTCLRSPNAPKCERMKRASQSAADFVRGLAELTFRLAAKDIVVSSLHADWSSFGCWQLLAQKGADAERYADGLRGSNPMQAIGPEVLRLFWDGREGILSVQSSPTRFLSAPNEWVDEHSEAFDKTEGRLLPFVEEYLTKRFS
jgi:hypothetical protein